MTVRVIISALLLLSGLFVFSVCVLGLFRFNNVLDRMHAASLGDTMGIMLTIAGLIVLSDSFMEGAKLSLTVIFIWLTSPVATHLIAKIELLTSEREKQKDRSGAK
ncbi:monovalent cation/H(+) antiporter subunit G [Lachnospiraceae bacterium NSJ-143]|mgnify:CR=1 FL=1|nr:monovalent cation/H(+) antiporter subunit G [Lachnospiraceae bacterium NSJ-143]